MTSWSLENLVHLMKSKTNHFLSDWTSLQSQSDKSSPEFQAWKSYIETLLSSECEIEKVKNAFLDPMFIISAMTNERCQKLRSLMSSNGSLTLCQLAQAVNTTILPMDCCLINPDVLVIDLGLLVQRAGVQVVTLKKILTAVQLQHGRCAAKHGSLCPQCSEFLHATQGSEFRTFPCECERARNDGCDAEKQANHPNSCSRPVSTQEEKELNAGNNEQSKTESSPRRRAKDGDDLSPETSPSPDSTERAERARSDFKLETSPKNGLDGGNERHNPGERTQGGRKRRASSPDGTAAAPPSKWRK